MTSDSRDSLPPRVPARMILHQEGVIAVLALVGLWMRDGGVTLGLAPRGPVLWSLIGGAALGGTCFAALCLLRHLAPLEALERWQRGMVRGWTATDVAAVAVFSGLAEEALVRALLQPLLGLLPAAGIFAVLHVVPDRRLWFWPVLALALGLLLGWAFGRGGYPAAAAAHTAINGLSLWRLRAAPAG